MSYRQLILNYIRTGENELAKEEILKIDDKFERRAFYSYLLFIQDHVESALDLIDKNFKQNSLLKNRHIIRSSIFKGFYLVRMGENIKAVDLLEFTKSLLHKLPEEEDEYVQHELAGDLYNILGIAYNQIGDVSKSMEHYQKAIEHRSILQNPLDLSITYANLSLIYIEQGLYRDAEQQLLNAHKILQYEEEHSQPLGIIFSNLGSLYLIIQNYQKARYYLLKAKELFEDHGTSSEQAEVFFMIVRLYIHLNLLNKAEEHLKDLEKIPEDESNPMIKYYKILGKAYLCKHKSRLVDKVNAMQLFRSVDDLKDRDISLYSFSMLNLADLLLFELTLTQDTSILSEINKVLEVLSDIASQNKSHYITIQTLIIQGKLFLLMHSFAEANIVLKSAYEIARKIQAPNLLNQIRLINDDQNLLLKQWEEIGKKYHALTLHDQDLMIADVKISFSKLSSSMKYIQEELDDGATDHEVIRKVLNREEYFPIVLYKLSEYGIEIIKRDFEIFPDKSMKEDLSTFLTNIGISFSMIAAQGDDYITGLFEGPAGSSKFYSALVYVFRMRDYEAQDPRLDLSFSFIIIFIPKSITKYLPPRALIEEWIDSIIIHYDGLREVMEFGLELVKSKIIEELRNWFRYIEAS